MMCPKIAKRLKSVEYAIRKFAPIARELERKGKKIIPLNIGDPLKFDFHTPEHIKEALCKAVKNNKNYYLESKGLRELREAICEKEKRNYGISIDPEHVVVTQGVAEAINFVIGTFIDPGDEILVPSPTYPSYIGETLAHYGKPVEYVCREDLGWMPDVEDIRKKISEKTKLIVIINPNNPTGSVYDEKIVREILGIAAENDLVVVSDEIYDRIIFEDNFKSTASLSKDTVVIGLNGFSKIYLMTGWRLGYLYVYDPTGEHADEITELIMKKAMNRICANTPVQYAGVVAIRGPHDHVSKMMDKLRKRRDLIYKRIVEIEDMSTVKPEGTFYIFPKISLGQTWKNDEDFVLELLKEEGVFLVHGSGFGETCGFGHFRAVFLPSEEIINEAFDKIEKFIKRKKLSR